MRTPSAVAPALAALVFIALSSCAGDAVKLGDVSRSASDGSARACQAPDAPKPVGRCELVCRAVLPLDTTSGSPAVTVWVDDKPTSMVLDTGSGSTALTPQAAARLGIAINTSVSRKTWGLGGTQTTHPLRPVSIAFGEIRLPYETIESISAELNTYSVPRDGLLGADILARYELELDILNERARLYEGNLCNSSPPGWSGHADSLPITLPFRGFHQIAIPVTLDRQKLTALLDTGADGSLVGRDAAVAGGAAPADLDNDITALMSGAGSEHPKAGLHRFATLQVGSETIINLDAAVTTLPFRQPGMLLGTDFLKANRVWISYGTGKVFFEPYAAR